jgi:hypothetical protein
VEEKKHLMKLLEDILNNDTSNETQKMLNYVKKREIDAIRNSCRRIAQPEPFGKAHGKEVQKASKFSLFRLSPLV